MNRKQGNFYERLMGSLDRLDPANLRSYLFRVIREQSFLEEIFDSLREGIIVIDTGLRVRSINTAAKHIFGINEEAVGQPVGKYLKQFAWEDLQRIPTESWGRFSRRELEIFYPEHRFLSFYLMPVPERPDMRKRDLPLATLIFHDVTETYEANEQHVETQKVKAITQLAAGVAHELGNPLNSLGIRLQIMKRKLKKYELAEEQRGELEQNIGIIEQEVTRLDTIVRNFLSAVRPEHLEVTNVDLREILKASLEFMQVEIESHQIKIELSLPETMPTLSGDSGQLTQAFYNIIKNAIQAMPDGGLLAIDCTADDNYVHIKFTDSGKGLSDEDISRIMEPYYTTKSSGTGLGLLIVDRIVRAHGGMLGIDGQQGKGASFTISLPHQSRRIRQLSSGEERVGREGGN